MSNQDWTSKLQDQLAGYQESVSHDLWAGIEQSLAQNNIESVSSNPQTIASESSESTDLHVGSEAKKNARIVYFKRWSAAAAAVALLGIGGSYVYLHQEDVEKGNLQMASLSSPAVSADLQSAASQSAPSNAVSADLQSAASKRKMGNALVEESENEISLLAENSDPAEPVSEDKATDSSTDHKTLTRSSDHKALTRSTENHAAAYASQSYHLKRMRRYQAGRCNSMPKT